VILQGSVSVHSTDCHLPELGSSVVVTV